MRNLLLIYALLFSMKIQGQSIQGHLLDLENNSIIPYATLVITNLNDGLKKISITDDNGIYSFKLNSGTYKLQINVIGYKFKQVDSIQIDSDIKIDFHIERDIKKLDEVVISAEKTSIEYQLDKILINIGSDINAFGGDVLNVIEQLPQIQSDKEGNISLRGSENIKVLINGKESPLSAFEALKQIPASNVKQIEVINSPSAKYQADGLTGIINIITNDKIGMGLSMNYTSSINSLGGYNFSANLGYGSSKINYRLQSNLNKDIFKNNNSLKRTGSYPFNTKEKFLFDGNIWNISGGVDYFFNSKNEFTLNLASINNHHSFISDYIIESEDFNDIQKNQSNHQHKTLEMNGNYRHVFNDSADHFLEIDIYSSKNDNYLSSEFIPVINANDNFAQNKVNIIQSSVDYSKKIKNRYILESGVFYNRQLLNNGITRIENLNSISSFYSAIISTYAAYSLLKFSANNFTFLPGLRFESFNRNGKFESNNTSISNEYNNFFPSFHLSFTTQNVHIFNFNYNRRTSRPSLSQVNPNNIQDDEFHFYIGNENLSPEFSNNLEFSHIYNGKAIQTTTSFYFRKVEDLITQNIDIMDGVTQFIPINAGSNISLGADLSLNADLMRYFKSEINFSYNHGRVLVNDQLFHRDEKEGFRFTINNKIDLNRIRLGLIWRYSSRQISYTYSTNLNQTFDLMLSYKQKKGLYNINLKIEDVFNNERYIGQSYGREFTRSFDYKPVSRILYFSIAFNLKSSEAKERNKLNKNYDSGIID